MSPRSPTVALISTRAMILAAEAAGVAVDPLLSEAGLSRERLRESEARAGIDRVLALWDRLRAESGNPTLQLDAPTCLPFGAYGVVDYLVDASATVGEAMKRFARFFGLIADRVTLSVDEDAREPFLDMALHGGGGAPPVYVDYVFAAFVGRVRMHIRPGLALSQVELRQPTPERPAPYEAFFRAPVSFQADFDRIHFSRQEWDAPTEHGDDALVRLLEKHAAILAERLPDPQEEIVADVQNAILETLPAAPKADQVARSLFVSPRTLQRKLARAGVTFGQVAERVRAELAKEYLSGGVSISEVAFMLGFSEQSSFHRAFRRWTGVAPGRWRRVRA